MARSRRVRGVGTNPPEMKARPTTLYVAGAKPDPLPSAEQRRPKRWSETPYGRWRLSVDVEAMRRFPDFRLYEDPGGLLAWVGSLESSLDPGRPYLVKVTYVEGFPDAAPAVAIEEPRLPASTPHLQFGNRPCLYHPQQGAGNGYDPARTTAATLVAWTALWIHAYETWKATGVWPGKAH